MEEDSVVEEMVTHVSCNIVEHVIKRLGNVVFDHTRGNVEIQNYRALVIFRI